MEIDRLEVVIEAQAAGARTEVNKLISDLNRLSGAINKSAKSSLSLKASIGKISSAVKGFASGASAASSSVAKAGNNIRSSMNQIGSGTAQLNKASNGFKGLLKSVLPFITAYKLFGWTKESANLASSLTEVQNVVDHAFGSDGAQKVERFAETSIQKYGMAALTAKQISSRYQSMGVAMGITADQVKKATDNISGAIVAEDYDKSATSLADMSLNLTRLAGDIASFYDTDVEHVSETLNSIFTGTTRPLRAYGLDLTQATLKEWAMKQGIDADIESMTQAQKTLLRYQYVMANTKMIQGDSARTADTWANSLRRLKQNFEALGATVGNIIVNTFKPVLHWMNQAIQNLNAFVKTVGNALGAIFGWTIESTPGALSDDAYGDIADAMEGAADGAGDLDAGTAGAAGNLNDATKAAEKLRRTILGFDEINPLNAPNETTGSGGGTSGTGGKAGSGSGAGSGTGGIGSALAGNSEVVAKAGDNLVQKYKSAINSLGELGEYIGSKIKESLGKIKWETEVYPAANKFGTGLAEFLNGLVKDPTVFGAVGTSAAASLNTALQVINGFGETFKWDDFGTALGIGLQNFFDTFDGDLAAENFSTFVNGLSKTIRSAVGAMDTVKIGTKVGNTIKKALKGIKWKTEVFPALSSVGSKLAGYLNGLFAADKNGETVLTAVGGTIANALNGAMTAVNSFATTFDWSQFGANLGKGLRKFFNTFNWNLAAKNFKTLVNGIADTIISALENFRTGAVGRKVGNMVKTALGGIEWETKVFTAAKLFASRLATFLNGLFSANTFSAITTTVANLLNTALNFLNEFGHTFDWDGFGTSIKNGLMDWANTFDWALAADTFSTFVNGVTSSIIACLGTEFDTESVGNKVAETVKTALQGITWDGEEGVFKAVELFGEKLASFLVGLCDEETFAEIGTTVANSIKAALKGLASFGEKMTEEGGWDAMGSSIAASINSFFSKIGEDASFAKAFNTMANGLRTAANSALSNISWLAIGQTIRNEICKLDFENLLHGVGELIWNAINASLDFFKGLFSDTPISEEIDGMKTTINEAVAGIDFESLNKGFNDLKDALSPFVVGFAQGLTDVFGKLAEITPEVLKKIGEAFQTIADAINSLPDGVVEKFGKDLGTVAGAFILIKGATGVASTIGSVVGKFGGLAGAATAAATGTKSVGKSLEKTNTQLEGLGSSFATNTAATVLFNDATEQVIGHLTGTREESRKTDEQLGAVAGALWDVGLKGDIMGIKMTHVTAPMNHFSQEEAPDFTTAFGEIVKRFEEAGGDSDALKEKLKLLLSENTFDSGRAQAIRDYIYGIGTDSDASSKSINDYIVPAFNTFKGLIGLTTEKLRDGLKPYLENTETASKKFGETVSTITNPALETTSTDSQAVADTINQILNPALGNTETDSQAVADKLNQILNPALGGAESAMSKVGSEAKDNLTPILKNQLNGALGDVGGGSDTTKDKIGELQGTIWGFAGNMLAKTIMMAVLTTCFGKIDGSSDTTKGKIEGLSGEVSTMAETFKTKSEESAENYTTGFENGMDKTTADVLDKVSDFGKDIVLKLNNALGIKSPSTEAKDSAKYFTEGFSKGIEAGDDSVFTDIKSFGKEIISKLEGELGVKMSSSSESESIAISFLGGFSTGLANDFAVEKLKTNLGTVSGTIIDAFSGIPGSVQTYGTDTASDFVDAITTELADDYGSGGKLNGISSTISSAFNIDTYNIGKNVSEDFVSGMKSVRIPAPHYSFEYWSNDVTGQWGYNTKVNWFANGGFPNAGELFVANEAGPEMVGKMGNRNAVASNDQITEGIREAVVDGMMQVAMATGSNNNDTPYVIHATLKTENDEVLARAVERGRAKRDARFNTVAYSF